jgi:hypothetical protein
MVRVQSRLYRGRAIQLRTIVGHVSDGTTPVAMIVIVRARIDGTLPLDTAPALIVIVIATNGRTAIVVRTTTTTILERHCGHEPLGRLQGVSRHTGLASHEPARLVPVMERRLVGTLMHLLLRRRIDGFRLDYNLV